MKIERAQKEDHLALSEITYSGKAFWGYGKAQMEKWKPELTVSPEYIEANETCKLSVNGKVICYYSILQYENNVLKVDNMFLLPEYIGKGYGKILMDDCIRSARQSNIQKIILDAEPHAELFYSHFGFRVYGRSESSIKNRWLPQMVLDLD